jgi:MarR family 2-MHQ and catechol resistance regulon transcriptional repressor
MGTHHQGPKPEVLALDAYIKLMRAADSVTDRAHLVLPPGVTLTQFAALEALYHLGPLFQSELAAKLLKSGGNLTLVVDNLERDGLVSRTRDPADRRYIKVELTAKGRRFIGALFPKVAKSIAHEFAVLTSRDQIALARICKRLGVGQAKPAYPEA